MDIMLIVFWTLITIVFLALVCIVVVTFCCLGMLAQIGAATISAFLDRD